jgi:hypothetical protein
LKSTFVLLTLFLSVGCAHAKPKASVVPPPPVAKPEYVDQADAESAVVVAEDLSEASLRLDAAKAMVELKKAQWQKMRAKFVEKYGIDPEAGDGWDQDANGKLKVRRGVPKAQPKAEKSK